MSRNRRKKDKIIAKKRRDQRKKVPKLMEKKIQHAVDKIVDEYGDVLKKLGEE